MAEYVYDAFISYSHSDIGHAKWLQRKLETFRIPKDLLPENAEHRKLRVFRDQTDLAGVELQDSLRKELQVSEYLIVICSPRSAASVWVNEEVEYFRSIGRGDHIIPFIVEGEAESDNAELECYPPGLRAVKDRHLLGANIQEIGKNKAFLKIVSIIIDVRFNRLVDREKQRKRRTIAVTVLTAAVVAAVVSGLLLRNASISKRNRELSYDIYGAALLTISQKENEEIQPEDIEFLKVSSKEGNTEAMLFLADCYIQGWGVDKDPEAAFELLMEGAEAGDTVCMIGVSDAYSLGRGVEMDKEKSYEWDQKAADAGDPTGMLNVGICYEEGIGVEKDPEQAFEWYKKSAEGELDLGIHNLARCYLTGVGTEVDAEKAFEWEMKLAELGNSEAMYNIGLMYQKGWGADEDPEQAYYWYRKSAEAGDGQAAYMVGWCTENNYGTKDAALEWYKAAKELGYEKAGTEIERLEREEKTYE